MSLKRGTDTVIRTRYEKEQDERRKEFAGRRRRRRITNNDGNKNRGHNYYAAHGLRTWFGRMQNLDERTMILVASKCAPRRRLAGGACTSKACALPIPVGLRSEMCNARCEARRVRRWSGGVQMMDDELWNNERCLMDDEE